MIDILISDTPNEGRVKINTNFSDTQSQLDNKISSDGTTLMQVPLDMNSYSIENLGAGTNPTSAVNKEQMDTGDNQLVIDRYIYVNEPDKFLYLDGTNANYGVKVEHLATGLLFAKTQNDATVGYEWTIKLPFKSTYHRQQSFVNFSDYINVFGEGRPIVEISDGTTVGVADIIGNSRISGTTLVYKDGKELNIGGDIRIDDCDIYMTNQTGITPRILTIRGAVVTNCRIVADEIILDSTTGNFIDNCIITVDNFTNPENNEINATNKTITNLDTYYQIYTLI